MRVCFALLFVVLLAACPRPVQAYDFFERVEMSDGTGLSTWVVVPDAGVGPWPVLFVRTPYAGFGPGVDFVDMGIDLLGLAGFVGIVQDTRGQGLSEGVSDPFFHDRSDGLETLDWVLQQPWCNGSVVGFGVSGLGIPAYLMGPGAREELVCQAAVIATPDVFGITFHGGVFKKETVEAYLRWIDARDTLHLLADHRDCDDYWAPIRVVDQGAEVGAAGLHVGGWYDPFTEGILAGFRLYEQADDPWVAEHQFLVMGPWSHFSIQENVVGELVFPRNARRDMIADLLGFLLWCGESPGASFTRSRAQYYTIGDVDDPEAPGNEWRSADGWPPFETVATPYYLLPDGGLSPDSPAEPFDLAFPFDPADPSPTRGGRNLDLPAGPRDQADVEARADALVFSSPVLEEPVESTGRIGADLWVATSGVDGDIAFRLTDVYPDGRSILVTEGIARMSRRAGCEAAVAVTPGEVVALSVDLLTTSYVFNRGHRIRVVVAGSNYPRYELNPAVDAPIELRLVGDSERPSQLVLAVPAPPDPPPVEPVAEPVTEPVTEPVAEAVTEPVAEAVTEPVAEPVTEPAAEPVAEPVAVAEPVDDVVAEVNDSGTPSPEVVPGPDVAAPAADDSSSGGCAAARRGCDLAALAVLLLGLAAVRRGYTAAVLCRKRRS